MALVLGIDAGGSRTDAALAEVSGGELRVLARAEAGSTKLLRVSEEHAARIWHELLSGLASQARVSLLDVSGTCAGLSGHTVERVRLGALGRLRALVAGEISLCGDEEIALEAAFGSEDSLPSRKQNFLGDRRGLGDARSSGRLQNDEPGLHPGGERTKESPANWNFAPAGMNQSADMDRNQNAVLVIAGTGSHAVTRAAGVAFHAGGWGPALGDEGSGYWIGREAVRQALRARDERLPSLLLERIAQAWECVDSASAVAEIVAKGHAQPPPDFSLLAPLVDQCAREGDHVSVVLLGRAGEELARLAALAWAQSGRSSNANVRIAWTGSVLREMKIVRDGMRAALWVQLPQARLDTESVDPVMGALHKAAALVGCPVSGVASVPNS